MEPNEKMLEDVVKKFEARMLMLSKYGDAIKEIEKAENEGRISKQEAAKNIAFIVRETMDAIQTIKRLCMVLAIQNHLNSDELTMVRTHYAIMVYYENKLKEVLGS